MGSIIEVMQQLVHDFMLLVTGAIVGVLLAAGVLSYFLFAHDSKVTSSVADDDRVKNQKRVDKVVASSDGYSYVSEDDINILKQALQSVDECVNVNHETDINNMNQSKELIALLDKILSSEDSVSQLEKVYNDSSKDMKDRIKQMKTILAVATDLSKCYTSHGRDVAKTALIAKLNKQSFVKLLGHKDDANIHVDDNRESNSISDSSGSGNSSTTTATATGNASIFVRWLNDLHASMESLSQSQECLGEQIVSTIVDKVKAMIDEQILIEKKLSTEGNKYINNLKDCTAIFEVKLKERDRYKREKVDNSVLIHHTNEHLDVQSTISQLAYGDMNKRREKQLKLDEAVLEQQDRLNACKDEYTSQLYRVILDYHKFLIKSCLEMKAILQSLSDVFISTYSISCKTLSNFKLQVSSSKGYLVGYEDSLKNLYESIVLSNIADSTYRIPKLDMTIEASSVLSATAPSSIASLPSTFKETVGIETCVWFNALMGRIFRDIACSQYFQEFFRFKATVMLNKGKRPGYIDDFKVEHVSFGALPPLLSNVQWIPKCYSTGNKQDNDPEIDYDVECMGDVAFRSGIKFKITTRIWVNWPVDRYASIPVSLDLEMKELVGKVRFGVVKKCSYLSFLEEPLTQFTVHSEVGDQYKFKDIPKLSEYVIKKIKMYIKQKLVHPNSHKFRLVWPRTWWPVGCENEYLPVPHTAASPISHLQTAVSSPEKQLEIDVVRSDSPAMGTPAKRESKLSKAKDMLKGKFKNWFTHSPSQLIRKTAAVSTDTERGTDDMHQCSSDSHDVNDTDTIGAGGYKRRNSWPCFDDTHSSESSGRVRAVTISDFRLVHAVRDSQVIVLDSSSKSQAFTCTSSEGAASADAHSSASYSGSLKYSSSPTGGTTGDTVTVKLSKWKNVLQEKMSTNITKLRNYNHSHANSSRSDDSVGLSHSPEQQQGISDASEGRPASLVSRFKGWSSSMVQKGSN